jgi:hypothetical protein
MKVENGVGALRQHHSIKMDDALHNSNNDYFLIVQCAYCLQIFVLSDSEDNTHSWQ